MHPEPHPVLSYPLATARGALVEAGILPPHRAPARRDGRGGDPGLAGQVIFPMRSSTHEYTHSPDGDRTLVIMAKAPRAGGVKSRLAQNLPPSAVVELYRCLLEDTLALARSFEDVEVAMMCPPSDVADLSQVAGEVRVVAQEGEGLAAGLASVFAHFATGVAQAKACATRVIALDSDSPHLPASVLLRAFETLASRDLVVGPTEDGGYYLVGATASYPGLFTGVGMGTTNALEALLARARSLGLSVGLMDPFYDIDVEADLSRLAAELEREPGRAPRTAAWLVEWRRMVAAERPGIGHP